MVLRTLQELQRQYRFPVFVSLCPISQAFFFSRSLSVCRYVSGDYRFKTGYCRSNPRKMVKMWAEKELRNLARLRAAGLNVPAPIQLRMHVLVMEFIGEVCVTTCPELVLPLFFSKHNLLFMSLRLSLSIIIVIKCSMNSKLWALTT
jgi:hypothetical protein